MKILILTVGGSSQPLVTSIKQNVPDKIVFICSQDTSESKGSYTQVRGKGNVCEKGTRPSILKQAGAEAVDHQIIKVGADDLDTCYKTSLDIFRRMHRKNPDAEILADITGGTKSMSSGLSQAASERDDIRLIIQTGVRRDLVKVVNGTESTHVLHTPGIRFNQRMKLVEQLCNGFAYAAAVEVMEQLGKTPGLRSEDSDRLGRMLSFARGFDRWDKFDHACAWDCLRHFQSDYPEVFRFLESAMWSRGILEPEFKNVLTERLGTEPKGHGYELVQDLVLNAERRAAQGRYDDAVGRLYRALEMLAQAQLKYRHSIDTADVPIEEIPSKARDKYEQKRSPQTGKIKIGLRDAYELLAAFPEDPLGQIYSSQQGKLIDFLGIRNNSLEAHGFTPVTELEYQKAKTLADYFVDEGIKAILGSKGAAKVYAMPIQFPQSIPVAPRAK